MGFIFSTPIGFMTNLVYIFPLLWWLLFFGSALVPAATGVIVNSVGREHQAASSSLEQLIINLAGYFASPIITAYIMEQFKDPVEGMIWGFRVTLWWSVFSIFFLLFALIAAYNKYGLYEEFTEDEGTEKKDIDVDTLTINELQMEMIRRRMHSYSF
jgi:MFS family permease